MLVNPKAKTQKLIFFQKSTIFQHYNVWPLEALEPVFHIYHDICVTYNFSDISTLFSEPSVSTSMSFRVDSGFQTKFCFIKIPL